MPSPLAGEEPASGDAGSLPFPLLVSAMTVVGFVGEAMGGTTGASSNTLPISGPCAFKNPRCGGGGRAHHTLHKRQPGVAAGFADVAYGWLPVQTARPMAQGFPGIPAGLQRAMAATGIASLRPDPSAAPGLADGSNGVGRIQKRAKGSDTRCISLRQRRRVGG